MRFLCIRYIDLAGCRNGWKLWLHTSNSMHIYYHWIYIASVFRKLLLISLRLCHPFLSSDKTRRRSNRSAISPFDGNVARSDGWEVGDITGIIYGQPAKRIYWELSCSVYVTPHGMRPETPGQAEERSVCACRVVSMPNMVSEGFGEE